MTDRKAYFFVDESGDTTFFDRKGNNIVGKNGCSKVLVVGLIKTFKPSDIHYSLNKLKKIVINDPYYNKIPSIEKIIKRGFHAKDDIPEIREKVFKLIRNLPIKAEIVVARKIEKIFRDKYDCNENSFYDDMISKLFESKLHKSPKIDIYFAKRSNRNRQKPLNDAIVKAKNHFEKRLKLKVSTNIRIFAQTPNNECCLQIIDYINWAIQRVYERKEERYFDCIKDNIRYIQDIFDYNRRSYNRNCYNKKNIFNAKKISPLKLG